MKTAIFLQSVDTQIVTLQRASKRHEIDMVLNNYQLYVPNGHSVPLASSMCDTEVVRNTLGIRTVIILAVWRPAIYTEHGETHKYSDKHLIKCYGV